jgi:peptide/nickel transport system permease protein
MGAPLPEALLPSESAAASGFLPAAGEPSARRRRALGRTLEIAIPGGILIVIAAACFLLPLVYSVPPPTGGNVLNASLPAFSPGHVLGTDSVGNDIFSRLLYGGRASIEVGLAVTLVGLVIGGLLGAVAGYWGGAADAVTMRVLDVLIAFPALVLALAIAEGLGPSELHVIWALSAFSIPAFGRITRAATLQLREQNFMLAARLAGTRTRRMLIRHIAPNILPQLVTFCCLGIGITIILEGALSYLGYGIPAPNPSWGSMIARGYQTISAEPSLVLIPSVPLFVTVLSLNLLADGLRTRWGSR